MLKGDLTTTPLAPLLISLAEQDSTGCLHISDAEGDEALIYFKSGLVYAVMVPGRRPQLGAKLISSGALTPEALAEALEAQRTELQGWKLGELLVHLGFVDQPVVEAFVREQVHDAVWDLIRWTDGRWRFRKSEKTREDVAPPMTVHELLENLRERGVEWEAISHVVHGPTAVPVLSARGGGAPEMMLDADAWSMLCKIDGERSVAELARDCGYTLFEAGQVLVTLVQAGLVDIEEEVDLAPPADDPVDHELYGATEVSSALAAAFGPTASEPSEGLDHRGSDQPDEPFETGSGRDDHTDADAAMGDIDALARLVSEVAASVTGAEEHVHEAPSQAPLHAPDDDSFASSVGRVSAALADVLGPATHVDDPFEVPAELRIRKAPKPKPTTRERTPEEQRREALRAAAAAELAAAHALAEALRDEQETARRADDEARRTAEEDAARLAAEEEARRLTAEEEAARIAAEEEAARIAAEEEAARVAAEEEAARLAAEEAARIAAEEEAVRLAAEEEAARLAAEEAARVAAEEEAARIAAEEEAARLAAEEEAARVAAEEEAARVAAEEEAARIAAEEEAARVAAEEEAARLAAEEEAARLAAEEAARVAAEEEAARLAAEEEAARLAAEEAARVAAEEEAARVAAEEEAARLAAEEEAARVAAEEEAARIAAEEEAARLAAEEEARRLAEEEAARIAAEEEAARIAAEEEAARIAAERERAEDEAWAEYWAREAEELARQEAEAQRVADEEAARLAAEEEAVRAAEEEAARIAAEEQAARLAAEEAERAAAEAAAHEAEAAAREAEERERRARAAALLSEFATHSAAEEAPVEQTVDEQPQDEIDAPAELEPVGATASMNGPASSREMADTAALLRELSSLGLDDDPPSAPPPPRTPSRPPTTPAAPAKKKKRGLFGL